MAKKLVIVLCLLVVIPLALVAWLGLRLARDERRAVRQQMSDVLTRSLRGTDQVVGRYFERCQRDFLQLAESPRLDAETLRTIVRTQPRVRQVFLLAANGDVLHPPLDGTANDSERQFLQRAQPFLTDKDLVRLEPDERPNIRVGNAERGNEKERVAQSRVAQSRQPEQSGWFVWYWGRGVNLIFWRRYASGQVFGIELERSRWMADLIAELPPTLSAEKIPQSEFRVQLADSNRRVVYQWGSFEVPHDAVAAAEIPVSPPLDSWRLKYFVDQRHTLAAAGRSVYFNLLSGLVAAGLGLSALAVYFYRESSRELRESETRVNFVNQVSHELKTPLTNIRMYADLLERDLDGISDEAAASPRKRLDVIVSESQRLSRLIGNVLTFAKQHRGQISLRRRPAIVDQVIGKVARQFEPILARKNIKVSLRLAAPATVSVDADCLEQILVNLMSNADKYATGGQRVTIESSQNDATTTIVITDDGPGVASQDRERIFQPFFRGSHDLETAAGAGIGLAIARSLARLHGGDLRLLESQPGAKFEIRLHTPPDDHRPKLPQETDPNPATDQGVDTQQNIETEHRAEP